MAQRKDARWAVISCTHVPYQSERALERLLQELAKASDEKPLTHFVHLGDLIDAEAASVHRDDPSRHTLYDEYCQASDVLRRIRRVLPKDCTLILHDGNHDDNVQKQDSRRIDCQVRPMCDPRKLTATKDEFLLWKNIPYRTGADGCFQLGPVIFAHGWSAAANSDELEALQLAYACGGHAWRIIIRGHTHRPARPTQCRRTARALLPWWYANVGHTAFDERAAYTYRFDVEQWGRGMILGECRLGRHHYSGKEWEAELISLDES